MSRNNDWSESEPEEEELVDVIVDASVDVGGPEDDKVPKKIVSQLLDLAQVDLENEEIWRIVVPVHVRGHFLMTSRGKGAGNLLGFVQWEQIRLKKDP